ncbi:aspartate dehydrogenase [uncultured Roseovarius sp.]|uniref:aspartate dehydrogenase n=1 Tax=uncultured Roseovarius sp. TaxID=293344 RepID=UPI002630BD95|nr:aspartate dehydrogenase [uncultured Roseovarius sp.]
MPHFNSKHGPIAFTDSKAGPPLFLIPGLGGQSAFWAGAAAILHQHFRVISFDYPGSGGSAGVNGRLALEDIADLAFALLDHLDVDQADVIGQSMGGAVAQIMALRCPARIGKLVLSSTWVAPDKAFERGFALRRQILAELGLAAYAKAQVLAVMSAAQIADNPEQASAWEQMTLEKSDTAVLLTRIDALLAFDNAGYAPQITQPTLVFATQDDQVVPVHMSKRLARLIPDARLQIKPAGGHFLPMTNPKTYLEQVLPFLCDASAPLTAVSVVLIGCGAIGEHIIDAVQHIEGVDVRAVLVRPERVHHYAAHLSPDIVVASDMSQLGGVQLNYAIECAGHDGLRDFGPDVLRHGLDLGVLSAGAMTNDDTVRALEIAAQDGNTRIEILSGALAGVDALRALSDGGLETVHITSRKPPKAWLGSAAENVTDLEGCTAPVTLFSGTAREAAQLYPKNANVCAIVAQNGLGPDSTRVTLIADPDITRNSHELAVSGRFGSFTSHLQSIPLPENPRTSAVAALSAVAAIRARRAGKIK